MAHQLAGADPLESPTTQSLRLILSPHTSEKSQVNGFFRIRMIETLKQLADGDFDTKFLTQLAGDTFLECLVGLTFPAGEFPKSSQMSLRMPLRDE